MHPRDDSRLYTWGIVRATTLKIPKQAENVRRAFSMTLKQPVSEKRNTKMRGSVTEEE